MLTAADFARRVEPLPSILIVDADADTRLLYRTLPTGVAGTILEAEDGAEAFGKAVCRQPDVILTGTRLRHIDGYALCAYLRREQLTRSAAIVVVTGAALYHARRIETRTLAAVMRCSPNTSISNTGL